VTPQGTATSFSCCNDPEGIAVDLTGNIWVADYGGYSVVELSPSGVLLHNISTAAGSVAPLGIAIDGIGNVWTANYYGNSITAILGATGSMISSPAGLGLDAPLNEPYGIAVDMMGSLWISNAGNSTLTQFVGLASPVRTPLLGPPVQP
jgi:DNA-binding beta-propeller fold protein YncE